jgi:hypothetical protein
MNLSLAITSTNGYLRKQGYRRISLYKTPLVIIPYTKLATKTLTSNFLISFIGFLYLNGFAHRAIEPESKGIGESIIQTPLNHLISHTKPAIKTLTFNFCISFIGFLILTLLLPCSYCLFRTNIV